MNEPLAIIRDQTARFAGVTVSDLLKPTRGRRRVHWARQVGYWVARETTGSSYPEIARAFGRSSHTTVLEGVRVVKRHMHPDLEALRDSCRALVSA